ncbi:hypothetical protein AB4672_21710 [Bacillus paralicheniformis]|uniref:hypothetical protein n=1 Tax=Bacillus paralicheniformis TaxID=1648923 RepID=UPI0034D1F8EB
MNIEQMVYQEINNLYNNVKEEDLNDVVSRLSITGAVTTLEGIIKNGEPNESLEFMHEAAVVKIKHLKNILKNKY